MCMEIQFKLVKTSSLKKENENKIYENVPDVPVYVCLFSCWL